MDYLENKFLNTVIHVSCLPFFTVSMDHKAGMPSLVNNVREFVRRGWRSLFIYPVSEHKAPYVEDGIEFIPIYFPLFGEIKSIHLICKFLNRIAPLAYIVVFTLQVIMLCLKVHPTLIYAHSVYSIHVSTIVKRFIKIPVVARIYGFKNPEFLLGKEPFRLKGFYWKLFEALALACKADLYVVTQDGTSGRQVMTKWGLENRSLVLPNGVDRQDRLHLLNCKKIKNELGLFHDQVVITYIGRFEQWKRIDRIIKVAVDIKKRNLNWVIVLAGDGGEKPYLEKLVKDYKLEHVVKFIGIIPHQKVWELLYISNIFLSLHDLSSLSNTLLEALSVGTPVVCSYKGDGIDDFVIDGVNGKLVEDPDDPINVINCLTEALKITKAGTFNTNRLFTWEDRLEQEFTRIDHILQSHFSP